MVINKIILKNTKLKEVSIPYPEFSSCGASFLLENRVPPPFCPNYLPWVVTPSSPHYVFVT